MATEKMSLCWRCANAVPDRRGHGCSWSRDFVPVKGWRAKRADLKGIKSEPQEYIESYYVISCPDFKEG